MAGIKFIDPKPMLQYIPSIMRVTSGTGLEGGLMWVNLIRSSKQSNILLAATILNKLSKRIAFGQTSGVIFGLSSDEGEQFGTSQEVNQLAGNKLVEQQQRNKGTIETIPYEHDTKAPSFTRKKSRTDDISEEIMKAYWGYEAHLRRWLPKLETRRRTSVQS